MLTNNYRVVPVASPFNSQGLIEDVEYGTIHNYLPKHDLTTMNFDRLAAELVAARKQGTRCNSLPNIDSINDAYAIQAAVNACEEDDPIGFKLGATADASLELLNLEKPFYGEIFKAYHRNHNDAVAAYPTQPISVETEFVIGLGQDIKRGSSDVSIEDVKAATAWVAPGFEIVGSRFNDPWPNNGHKVIADAAGNVSTILGAPVTDWQSFDLDAHEASLHINGEHKATGHSGMSIGGNPLTMLSWLINQPAFATRGLKAGEFVFCGTCTGLIPISIGDQLSADFGAMGSIAITVNDASA